VTLDPRHPTKAALRPQPKRIAATLTPSLSHRARAEYLPRHRLFFTTVPGDQGTNTNMLVEVQRLEALSPFSLST